VKKLDEWAKGRPIFIAIASQQIAFGAEPCFQALHALKSGEPVDGFTEAPHIDYWISLYKNHKKITESFKKTFSGFDELSEIGISISDLLSFNRKQRRMLGSKKYNNNLRKKFESLSQEDWDEIQNFWKEVYLISLDSIKSDIAGEYDKELSEKIKNTIKEPEMIFYLRVWVPCWMLYGELPPTLLRSARLGNIEALEKLIRLDNSVIHEPKIAEILHQASAKKNKSTYNLLVKAQLKGPKTKITLQKIKMNFAGFISAASSAFGHRLSEPEIRSLFDAVACDTGKGDIDTDIPDSPEAFAKAIQRERQFWSIIPQPDKK